MSRLLAVGGLLVAGAAVLLGTRRGPMPDAPYMGQAEAVEVVTETGEVVALPLPPPPPPWQGRGRLSVSDVLALLPQVDPEGWMPRAEALAFVEVESNFNPGAYRFERHLNEASYGLMQTLESTARDMGLQGPAEGLYDPATSLRVGISYSRWSWDFLTRRLGREPTESEWVGSYNAGVGNTLRGFVPHAYLRKWQLARERYQL